MTTARVSLVLTRTFSTTSGSSESSSVIVNVTPSSLSAPLPPASTVPSTATVTASPISSLSTAVIVTVPVLSVAPAGMVSVLFSLRVAASPPTCTVIVVGRFEVPTWVAVTVTSPPSSEVDVADSTSVTCGRCFAGSRLPYFSTGYCQSPPKSHGSVGRGGGIVLPVEGVPHAEDVGRGAVAGGGLQRDGAGTHACDRGCGRGRDARRYRCPSSCWLAAVTFAPRRRRGRPRWQCRPVSAVAVAAPVE